MTALSWAIQLLSCSSSAAARLPMAKAITSGARRRRQWLEQIFESGRFGGSGAFPDARGGRG
jgi:hypothetical protein